MGSLNWVGLLQCNLRQCFRNGSTLINSGGGDTAVGALDRLDRDVLRDPKGGVFCQFEVGPGCNPATFWAVLEEWGKRG